MASYPHSISRITNPQMGTSKGQPKAIKGKQAGLQSAAARRLSKTSKKGKLKGLPINSGTY